LFIGSPVLGSFCLARYVLQRGHISRFHRRIAGPACWVGKRPVRLPAIVDGVGSQIEVHMDGGIRSGQDVLKAWALGARGTYIGRAFNYGVGALGETGVTKALEIIHKELDLTMAFCGHTRIGNVDRGILLPGTF